MTELQLFAPQFDVPYGAVVLGCSNSELSVWCDCPRKWFLQYYMGWHLPESDMAATGSSPLGTRLHVALQAYYGRGLNPAEVFRQVYAREFEVHPQSHDELMKEFDLGIQMLSGYLEWLEETSTDRLLRPVGTEVPVAYPIGHVLPDSPLWFYLKAHLDVIMYDEEFSRYIFMDHKSVGGFDPLNLLQINEQFKMQTMLQRLVAQQHGGFQVAGVYINMLKRSKRTARATPPFYLREKVPYNNDDMKSMWARTYHRLSQIAVTREALDKAFRDSSSSADLRTQVQQALVPPTPSHDCTWKCPFFKQCPMMDDGSRWEDALAGVFQQGDPYAYYGRGLLEQLIEEGRVNG